MELPISRLVQWFYRRAEIRARVCKSCGQNERVDGEFCSDSCEYMWAIR